MESSIRLSLFCIQTSQEYIHSYTLRTNTKMSHREDPSHNHNQQYGTGSQSGQGGPPSGVPADPNSSAPSSRRGGAITIGSLLNSQPASSAPSTGGAQNPRSLYGAENTVSVLNTYNALTSQQSSKYTDMRTALISIRRCDIPSIQQWCSWKWGAAPTFIFLHKRPSTQQWYNWRYRAVPILIRLPRKSIHG